jgi:CspA family cold shock protein
MAKNYAYLQTPLTKNRPYERSEWEETSDSIVAARYSAPTSCPSTSCGARCARLSPTLMALPALTTWRAVSLISRPASTTLRSRVPIDARSRILSIRRISPPCRPSRSFAACKTQIRGTRLPEITLRPQGPAIPTSPVTWFNTQKGDGFLQPAHGDQDVFVPLSAVKRSGLSRLKDGEKMSDAIENDPRTAKISAVKLTRIELVQLEER